MNALATYAPYVEWDTRNWSLAPRFWEDHTSLALSRCRALELGSRHGGLSLWLARAGAEVTCTDLHGPTAVARERHAAAGVANRVRYAALDVTHLEERDRFDVIVFKSMLGAVGGADRRRAQQEAIARIHRALRPGGELFFAENLAASAAHRYFRQRFVAWGQSWRYVTVAEMREFLAPFASVTYRTAGFSGAFGRSPRQKELLGAVDRAGLDRLVPETWRYIILGVARK
jgi:SAM-dependent methyltransferase